MWILSETISPCLSFWLLTSTCIQSLSSLSYILSPPVFFAVLHLFAFDRISTVTSWSNRDHSYTVYRTFAIPCPRYIMSVPSPSSPPSPPSLLHQLDSSSVWTREGSSPSLPHSSHFRLSLLDPSPGLVWKCLRGGRDTMVAGLNRRGGGGGKLASCQHIPSQDGRRTKKEESLFISESKGILIPMGFLS